MNTENMNRMMDNWINGNRTTARSQARRTTAEAIAQHLTAEGWTTGNAWILAAHLKGADNYQAACDATAAECHTANF
jgi:hypothetical protein